MRIIHEKALWVFDFDFELGEISNQELFFDFKNEPGIPDSLTVSAQGDLFVAMWNGSQVLVISNAGERMDIIRVPVQRPTSCVFGGENYDKLFVTSAMSGFVVDQDSLGGLLLEISGLGVIGKASYSFNG